MYHFTRNAFILIIFLSSIIVACTNSHQNKKNATLESLSDTIKENHLEAHVLISDTLVVAEKAAVFYEPDSSQIEKRMKEAGEEDFRAGAGDYLFYMHISNDYLDSVGLKILYANDKKFLKFVNAGQANEVIPLKTLPELWGVYFFQPGKKAKQVDITLIEDEYKSYFK